METTVKIIEKNNQVYVYKVGNKRPSKTFNELSDAYNYISDNHFILDTGGQCELFACDTETCTCDTDSFVEPVVDFVLEEKPGEKLNSDQGSVSESKKTIWQTIKSFLHFT
jgi:hypothetical protein